MDRKRQNLIILLLVLLMTLPMIFIRHIPMQDIPDWILQAKIINNLDDPGFSKYYSLRILPVPNSLGTLLIFAGGRFICEESAAKVVTFLAMILFTFGFVYLRRADGRLTPHIEMIGLLFGANHFLMMGYLNFSLGLALGFFAIGYYWRRAPFFAKESSVVLSFLLLLIYFSHFLAFLIAAITILIITWRTWFGDYKKYMLPAISFVPALLLFAWYAAARVGSFSIGYEYSITNYLFYKLSPFAPLSNYYPLSPALVAWGVALVNIIVILSLMALVIWLVKIKRAKFWSPMILASLVLFVLGLFAPTKFFELIRPGQRLIFASLFIFLAGVWPPRVLRKEVKLFPVMILATIIAVNGANMFFAGKHVDYMVRVIEKKIPKADNLLLLNDSHFPDKQNRTFLQKTLNPFSYPVWVNPLKQAAYYYVKDHGGLIGYLFPSGFIKVRDKRPAPINSLEHLASPDRTKEYSHIIITGKIRDMDFVTDGASHSFKTIYLDTYFRILERLPKTKTADFQ